LIDKAARVIRAVKPRWSNRGAHPSIEDPDTGIR